MSDFINYLVENMKNQPGNAAAETVQVKAGAGRLFRLSVANVNAAARTLYVFDNASADTGNLLFPPITIAIGGTLDLTWTYGRKFAAGARVHSSSTFATFTASASADFIVTADFI